MKKLLSVIMCVVMIFGVMPGALLVSHAEDVFIYRIDDSNHVFIKSLIDPTVGGDVVIPNAIDGKTVLGIDGNAFKGNENITSVTLPDTLTSIGASAFSGCKNLAKTYYEGTLTQWCSVIDFNDNPVAYSHNLYVGGELVADLIVPDGVIAISKNAFKNDTALTSVTLPDSLLSIGSGAFSGCSNIERTNYKGTLAQWCSDIKFTDNPAKLSKNLYINDVLITELNIPEGVEVINAGTFANNAEITTITLPSTIRTIASGAFTNVKPTATYYNGTLYQWLQLQLSDNPVKLSRNLYIDNQLITDLVIPEGVTEIKSGAFTNDEALVSVTIPSTVTTIANAFTGCKNIQKTVYNGTVAQWCGVKLTSPPSRISHNLYFGEELITDLVIPEGVKTINSFAFADNTALTSVTLPASLETINANAFTGSSNINKTTFNGTMAQWCALKLNDSPSWISHNLYLGETPVEGDIVIPAGVTTIGAKAFYDNPHITSVTLPGSLEKIDTSAFGKCNNITDVYFQSKIFVYADVKIATGNDILNNVPKHFGFPINWYVNDELYVKTAGYPGDPITLPEVEPSAEGHEFSGWLNVPDVMPEEPLSIYSTLTPCKYVASLMVEGELYQEIEYTYGQKSIDLPPVPKKEGFKGVWSSYTLGVGGTVINAIYGPITYEAKFMADGKVVGIVEYVTGSTSINAPEVPAKPGYTGKWADYTLPIGGVTVNAIYTPITYKATFVADEKTVGTVDYTVESTSITPPAVPAKPGYNAGRWESYTFPLPVGGITINAVYDSLVEYDAKFVADGKTVGTVKYTIVDEEITPPDVPEKTGYAGRWEEITFPLPVGGITVNAVYTLVLYTATFKAGDTVVGNVTYTIKTTSITPPQVPAKAGYTGKWENYTLAVGGITVNAVYTPIVYKAVFVADGVPVATVDYTVESTSIREPKVPVKPGYSGRWESYTLKIGGISVNAVYTFVGEVTSVTMPETLTIRFKGKGLAQATVNTRGTVTYTTEYYSSDESVASVNKSTGLVTGNARGSAVITCKVVDSFGVTHTATTKVTVNFAWYQWIVYYLFFGFIWGYGK